jgi:hypothetical protein
MHRPSAKEILRHLSPHALAILCLLCVATPAGSVEVPAGVQEKIDLSKSPDADMRERSSSGRSLTDDWRQALPGLIQQVDTYYQYGTPPYREDDVPSLVALTDIIRAIVLNREGAVQAFRSEDTKKTIQLLTWAARGSAEGLRRNATLILAAVIDNSNLCIVLDQLRDPNLTEDGRANLIQVATPAASYAYKENVEDVERTADIIRPLSTTPPLPYLLNNLEVRTMNSLNRDIPLPGNAACDYKTSFPTPVLPNAN